MLKVKLQTESLKVIFVFTDWQSEAAILEFGMRKIWKE